MACYDELAGLMARSQRKRSPLGVHEKVEKFTAAKAGS